MALHDLDAAISDREDRPAWLERHRMTADDYQASLEQLGAEGYRLRHVSGYAVDGQDLYAAVWDRTDGPAWQARHRLTADEYQATSDRLAADGYRLSCVSAYAVDDQDLYAAVWEQKDGPAWQAHHRLDGAGLEQMSETLARDGFRPVLITACPVDGRDLYAGLWQQGVAPETVAQHAISDKPEAEGFQRRELAESAGIHHVNGVSARVPRQSQDQQNWCWAAAAVSIDCAYNNGTSRWKQCDIAAEYFKRYDSKNYNCCGSDGPNACNKSAELENALRIVGHFVRFIKNPVAFETLTQELTRNRPVGVRIQWAGSPTGHFVVVAGCYTVGTQDWVLVMDPEHTGGMVHMPYCILENAYPPHRGTWTTTYFTA